MHSSIVLACSFQQLNPKYLVQEVAKELELWKPDNRAKEHLMELAAKPDTVFAFDYQRVMVKK